MSGMAFEDVDADGLYNPAIDSPMSVTVEVYEDDGVTLISSATANQTGVNLVGGMAPHDVVVRLVEPTQWGLFPSTPHQVVTVVAADTTTTVDFGLAEDDVNTGAWVQLSIDPGWVETTAGDGTEATVDGKWGTPPRSRRWEESPSSTGLSMWRPQGRSERSTLRLGPSRPWPGTITLPAVSTSPRNTFCTAWNVSVSTRGSVGWLLGPDPLTEWVPTHRGLAPRGHVLDVEKGSSRRRQFHTWWPV